MQPESNLCIKCEKDTKDDDVRGIIGIKHESHYVCQPCGEIYRLHELEFCTNYFKKKENIDDTTTSSTTNSSATA